MKKLALVLVVVAAVAAFVIYNQKPKAPAALPDVEMKYIKAEELKTALDNKDAGYLVVDVRKAEDYAKAHIPGAIAIDMDKAKDGDIADGTAKMKAGLGDEIKGSKKIILVCYSGKRYAQASTNVLSSLGANMNNVLTLEGGFTNWSKVYPDVSEK